VELGARLQRTTQIASASPRSAVRSPRPPASPITAFRTPGDETALSLLAALNQRGNRSFEVDANLPMNEALSLGLRHCAL